MPKTKQATVLDVGSEKLTILAGEHGVNKLIKVKGIVQVDYPGFCEGEFLNPEKLPKSVQSAIKQTEDNTKSRIRNIYVGVPSEFCITVSKEVAISFKSRRKVTEIDIKELYMSAPQNSFYSLINSKPVYFTLDGTNKTLSPEGDYCTELKGLLSFNYAENKFINRFTNMFENMGIEVRFVSSILAEGNLLFEDKQRQHLFADVGYITTGVALYQGEGLLFLKSFSAGGGHIEADLMECLHISFEQAVKLKKMIKLNLENAEEDKYTITGKDESISVSMNTANEVVEARIEKIAKMISRCITESGQELPPHLPVYITGGGLSYIRGATSILSGVLDRNVEIISPQSPKLDKPHMSSSAGVLDYALNESDIQKRGFWARLFG